MNKLLILALIGLVFMVSTISAQSNDLEVEPKTKAEAKQMATPRNYFGFNNTKILRCAYGCCKIKHRDICNKLGICRCLFKMTTTYDEL